VRAEFGYRDPDVASHRQDGAHFDVQRREACFQPGGSHFLTVSLEGVFLFGDESQRMCRAGFSLARGARFSRSQAVIAIRTVDLNRGSARQGHCPSERQSQDASINHGIRVHELPSGWLCE
jgi:hypothetical protein